MRKRKIGFPNYKYIKNVGMDVIKETLSNL